MVLYKNVIYCGSGNSSKLIDLVDQKDFVICGANNAWRLFKEFDFWIHSGDFPRENRPEKQNFKTEISYSEYKETSKRFCDTLGIETTSPQHYVGYTIFFLGLHWIMTELKPKRIGLLGFDHDYNPEKVKKWREGGQPNPQNQYLKSDETIKKWGENFFDGMKQDSFYGQGTPDPLRLGEDHLRGKFKQLIENSKKIGIEIVNLSPVSSGINPMPKVSIDDFR